MRIVQYVSVAALSCVAFSANASDNMNKKSAQIAAKQTAPSKHDWSGFRVGVNLGYGQIRDRADEAGYGVINEPLDCYMSGSFPECQGRVSLDGSGIIGGVSAGYDFQFGNFVFGAEGDFSFASIAASAIQDATPTDSSFLVLHQVEMNNLGTLRSRIGFVTNETLLFYMTGGLIAADIYHNVQVVSEGVATDPQWSSKKVKFGYTLGGGAEYAIAQNWSLKAEGLYYRFPVMTLSTPTSFDETGYIKFENDGYFARVGLNYHF